MSIFLAKLPKEEIERNFIIHKILQKHKTVENIAKREREEGKVSE